MFKNLRMWFFFDNKNKWIYYDREFLLEYSIDYGSQQKDQNTVRLAYSI